MQFSNQNGKYLSIIKKLGRNFGRFFSQNHLGRTVGGLNGITDFDEKQKNCVSKVSKLFISFLLYFLRIES
jgi:hypothetical protein